MTLARIAYLPRLEQWPWTGRESIRRGHAITDAAFLSKDDEEAERL
jgi:hypothetical protein